MKTIGLVGGIASGKSLVAKMLADLGAGVLDGDAEGHEILRQDKAVQQAIRQRWGEEVFEADGSVSRPAIAKKVFGDDPQATANLKFLEGLLHPKIGAQLHAKRDAMAAQGKTAVVLDAPLLLEAGWDRLCDLVVFVDALHEDRMKWIRARGWTPEEIAGREGSQLDLSEKRRRADVVLSNEGSEQLLRNKVQSFWDAHIEANQPGQTP
jgi:dephospho-CoA kinase